MKIVRTVAEMKNLSCTFQKSGSSVGLVPSMGALHRGHMSLLERVNNMCDCSVMSIFVNPIQFGPKEDFSQYPRPFDKDCEMAEAAGCDVIFAPAKEEMYPQNYSTYVDVEDITARLCGASRPGHFRGVATVVLKLFNIVNPQVAVFGQKDAQQVLVLKRMARDLNLSVNIEVAPIIREEDGLALSSRNVYLTKDERAAAVTISSGIHIAEKLYNGGERSSKVLIEAVRNEIMSSGLLDTEYIDISDTVKLQPAETVLSKALLAVACRTKQSRTRLIDNCVLGGTL